MSSLHHISHLSPLQMLVIIMMTIKMMINLRIQMYKYRLCIFIFRHVVKFIKKFYNMQMCEGKDLASYLIDVSCTFFTEAKREEKKKFDVTLFYSPAITFSISTYTHSFCAKMLKLNFLFYHLFMEEVILRLPS